ncbi:MAG: hypothetical protein M3354_04495 [Chloroflexota bacterium]|nr:hypothetical protein [Chloroflexota bacterium]
MVQQEERVKDTQKESGRFYTVFIDDSEYRFDRTPVTGGEIMDRAGIPRSVGLLLINEDNTQQTVGVDEEVELKPGRRFKKAPRFKRG